MNVLKKLLTILILLQLSLVLIIPSYNYAYSESMCPSYMDPNSKQCLNYLRDQLAKTNSNLSSIEKKLKNEDYQQLSLQEKINYINSQITETEKVIETLNIEIAANDIEISILSNEVKQKEDDISLLRQEITTLNESMNKRLTESYKYSLVTPLELFINMKDVDMFIRKLKYLLETRTKDKVFLEQHNTKVQELEEEEKILAEQQVQLQDVREQNETEKNKLNETRKELTTQLEEREKLLAESKKREDQLIASFDANRKKQSAIDDEIMRYLQEHGDQMADYGWVTKGTWIGRMGGTPSACSTGYHLHFAIDKIGSSYYDGYGQIDPWAGYLRKGPDWWRTSGSWTYYYVRSGSMLLPLEGTVVLTQDHHSSSRKAIDIYSLSGHLADVYAATDGVLSKGTDRCGDTYAVIKNSTLGIRTAYYHLE